MKVIYVTDAMNELEGLDTLLVYLLLQVDWYPIYRAGEW